MLSAGRTLPKSDSDQWLQGEVACQSANPSSALPQEAAKAKQRQPADPRSVPEDRTKTQVDIALDQTFPRDIDFSLVPVGTLQDSRPVALW